MHVAVADLPPGFVAKGSTKWAKPERAECEVARRGPDALLDLRVQAAASSLASCMEASDASRRQVRPVGA